MLDIFGKNYCIYWAKILRYIWHNYGINWSIGYIKKQWDIFFKIMRFMGQKLWDILWDIFVKTYCIYLTKNKGYIQNILCKTVGYIMEYNWQYF